MYKIPKTRRAFTLTQTASDRLDWLMTHQHVWSDNYKCGMPNENVSSIVESMIHGLFEGAVNEPCISKEKRSQILNEVG